MIPSQVAKESFLFKNQYNKKKNKQTKQQQTKQKVIFHFSMLIYKKMIETKTPFEILSELSSNIPEIKPQNESSINNNDDETLTGNDNRTANDKMNTFP